MVAEKRCPLAYIKLRLKIPIELVSYDGYQFVGNKAKRRISKRVLRFSEKGIFLTPWYAHTRFEIRLFVFIPTNYMILNHSSHQSDVLSSDSEMLSWFLQTLKCCVGRQTRSMPEDLSSQFFLQWACSPRLPWSISILLKILRRRIKDTFLFWMNCVSDDISPLRPISSLT